MAVAPLVVALTQPAANAFDFTPLMQLGQRMNQPQPTDTSLAGMANRATPDAFQGGTAPVPYAGSGGGSNVQSCMTSRAARSIKAAPGLTHEQAAGQVGNLQAESGSNIPSWGPTGDQGSAHGAAQWRMDRLANLQKFAADRGLDYRSTEAQQGFMRNEYLGSERGAYDRLTAAQTPQQAASVVNRYYERSADTSGRREANALRLSRQLGVRWHIWVATHGVQQRQQYGRPEPPEHACQSAQRLPGAAGSPNQN